MLAIQVTGLRRRDEKLWTIGMFATIGHADPTRAIMSQLKVLIIKTIAINTFPCEDYNYGAAVYKTMHQTVYILSLTPSTIPFCKITS